MLKMRLNQSGMGLIPVIIASGLLAAVTVGIMALYESLTAATNKTDARTEMDGIVRYVQGVLSHPIHCAAALRGPAGAPIAYNVLNPVPTLAVNVQQVEVSGAPVVSVGQVFGPPGAGRYRLAWMRLRRPTINESLSMVLHAPRVTFPAPVSVVVPAAGQVWTTTIPPAPRILNTQQLKLAFGFASGDGVGGDANAGGRAVSLEKTADVTVAVDPAAGNTIVACAVEGLSESTTNFSCNSAHLYGGPATECPPNNFPLRCEAIYLIAGFDGLGKPICQCQTICKHAKPG